MSNPNPRDFYNLRGNTNAEIQAQIRQLQAEAEVRTITDQGQAAGLAALNKYNVARDANGAAARDLPADVKEQLAAFLRRTDAVVGAGTGLRQGILPTPRTQAELTSPYARQYGYNSGLIAAAFAAKADIVANALQGIDQEAASILEAAYGAVAPMRPKMGCEDDDVAEAMRDVRSAIDAAAPRGNQNQVARQLLDQALTDNDLCLLYTLLNTPAKRYLGAMNVKREALLRAYADAKVATSDPATNPYPLRFRDAVASGIAGGAFLAVQATDNALAKVPALADAYYQAKLAEAKALLGSAAVQANIGQ